MSEPAEFVDEEVIKDKLDELKEMIEALTGRLEALQASIDELNTFNGTVDPCRRGVPNINKYTGSINTEK